MTVIKIKRGSGIPTTSALSSYELGYSTTLSNLYINNGGSITRIGVDVLTGSSAPASGIGQNGDTFYQTTTSASVTTIEGMFVKVDGEWLQVSTGGQSLPQAEGNEF